MPLHFNKLFNFYASKRLLQTKPYVEKILSKDTELAGKVDVQAKKKKIISESAWTETEKKSEKTRKSHLTSFF